MTADELLVEVEMLSHGARMRRMVEVGQTAADPTVAATLAELERRGQYERHLALQACFGSRDGAHALRAVTDPSGGIRTLAATLVPLLCDDAQVATALATVARQQRDVLLRCLQRRHRQEPIDAAIAARAAAGDRQWERSLPFASAPVVERLLPELEERLDREQWRRLARRHPPLAEGAIRQRLNGVGSLSPRLLWQSNGVLAGLGERDPDRAAALATVLSQRTALDRLDLDQVAKRRPVAYVRLILATGDLAGQDQSGRLRNDPFRRATPGLTDDEIVVLMERRFLSLLVGAYHWYRRLNPARRGALVPRLLGGHDSATSSEHLRILELAPSPWRATEARRQITRAELAAEPEFRLRFAALLPWDDAMAILAPYLDSPNARLRATALRALAGTVRFARSRAADLLALLHARRNEQDPVRRAFLGALAALPPGLWRPEHLPALELVLRDALDAADLSADAAQNLERLLVRLLPFQRDWAAAQLAVVARARGDLGFHGLFDQLTPAGAAALEAHLAPVLEAWSRQERQAELVALAAGLGPRLRDCPQFLDILEDVARRSRSAEHADDALALLAKHAPARLAALVTALLQADQSAITLPAVYRHLQQTRQDLLTPFLRWRRYAGRFATGQAPFLPPLAGPAFRWTARQQARYAAALSERIDDPELDAPTILQSIRWLADLPSAPPATLTALASEPAGGNVLTLTTPRRGAPSNAPPRQRLLARRDVALRTLARLDAGQGIPTLLEALQDERGPVAIYALRASVLTMPPDRALTILQGVPFARVRVGKEVVRLLGDLESEPAYRALLALAAQPLHRDVRVALLRGLDAHLEREESWRLLEQAAAGPDPVLAVAAGRAPATGLSAAAQERLITLLATLLARPEAEVRRGVLERCGELPVVDPQRRLLPRLLTALTADVPGEQELAAAALWHSYAEQDLSLLAETVRGLRDNRGALHSVVSALRIQVGLSRRVHGEAGRVVLAALAGEPFLAELRVRLALQALAGEELAAWFEGMVAGGEFHTGALLTALGGRTLAGGAQRGMAFAYLARSGLLSRLRRDARVLAYPRGLQGDAAALEALEARLVGYADERLRRVALQALLDQSDDQRGWDDERLARLRRYAADPSPLVAEPAQFELADVEAEQRLLPP